MLICDSCEVNWKNFLYLFVNSNVICMLALSTGKAAHSSTAISASSTFDAIPFTDFSTQHHCSDERT